MPRKVEISHKTIIFFVAFLLSLWFLYGIRDIVLELFVALLLTSILDPFVTKISNFKIPRGLAILFSYILILGFLGGIVALLAPPLIEQTSNFTNISPDFLVKLGLTPTISTEIGKEFLTLIGSIPQQILKFVGNILSNVIAVFTVLVFAFYLLLARTSLNDYLGKLFGREKAESLSKTLNTLEDRLGGWARGQLTLMLLVGVLNYIGLTILGVPFALPLALLAGLMEVVPYLGPIIAAVPGILIGFGISSFTGIGVVAMAILVQQLENYIFVPKIMGKSVGVSPIVILLSLAVGQRMAGVVGMIISIPVVIMLQVILGGYFSKEK